MKECKVCINLINDELDVISLLIVVCVLVYNSILFGFHVKIYFCEFMSLNMVGLDCSDTWDTLSLLLWIDISIYLFTIYLMLRFDTPFSKYSQ